MYLVACSPLQRYLDLYSNPQAARVTFEQILDGIAILLPNPHFDSSIVHCQRGCHYWRRTFRSLVANASQMHCRLSDRYLLQNQCSIAAFSWEATRLVKK